MLHYQWDFSVIFSRPELWLVGVGVTLVYAAGTIVLGLLLGIVFGAGLLSRRLWLRWIVDSYIQVFRCTPLLVQVVWFYYALPILVGLTFPAWLAAGLGLTLYMAAFCAEIFRGGIISIEKGQWDAAQALGLRWILVMRLVILPQAVKRMVPPIVNQSVLQLKNTSLLYIVAVPDMMYAATTVISDSYRPLEGYTGVAIMYFILLYPLQKLAKRLELRGSLH